MIKNIFTIKRTLLIGIIAIFISVGLMAGVQPVSVSAQKDLVCDGLIDATGNTNCGSAEGDPEPDNLLKTGINILSIAAGIIAVVMIMLAGLKFITSQGDSGKISSARTAVLYAIIGLVIVALSQTIVFFFVGNSSPPTTRNGDTQQRTGPR